MLAGGAVKLAVTMLYTDFTKLAMTYNKRVAAKVFKCSLPCNSKPIRAAGFAVLMATELCC